MQLPQYNDGTWYHRLTQQIETIKTVIEYKKVLLLTNLSQNTRSVVKYCDHWDKLKQLARQTASLTSYWCWDLGKATNFIVSMVQKKLKEVIKASNFAPDDNDKF